MLMRQARPGAMPANFAAAEDGPRNRATSARRPVESRIALGVCALMLGLLGAWSTMKALELRPISSCRVSPVHLMFASESVATMETRKGIACTIALDIGSAVIDDFLIKSSATHGRIMRRGRTGVIYLPEANYRGVDEFQLALRGRSPTSEGTAIIRVRVNVR